MCCRVSKLLDEGPGSERLQPQGVMPHIVIRHPLLDFLGTKPSGRQTPRAVERPSNGHHALDLCRVRRAHMTDSPSNVVGRPVPRAGAREFRVQGLGQNPCSALWLLPRSRIFFAPFQDLFLPFRDLFPLARISPFCPLPAGEELKKETRNRGCAHTHYECEGDRTGPFRDERRWRPSTGANPATGVCKLLPNVRAVDAAFPARMWTCGQRHRRPRAHSQVGLSVVWHTRPGRE